MLSKSHPIDCQPNAPLSALSKDNIFKLFFFDIGLLGHLLGLTYKEHLDQSFNYKGFIAENFVQNERIAIGINPSYSWEYARSEIECLEKLDDGEIIPIEVKSGKRTRAKSLMVYKQRYNPSITIKLVGTQGSIEDRNNLVLPIYYAAKLANFYQQTNTE